MLARGYLRWRTPFWASIGVPDRPRTPQEDGSNGVMGFLLPFSNVPTLLGLEALSHRLIPAYRLLEAFCSGDLAAALGN